MRRLAVLVSLGLLALGGLTACNESYTAVSDNQVIVQDDDGKLDKRNIAVACGEAFLTNRQTIAVSKIGDAGDDQQVALVTCGPVTP